GEIGPGFRSAQSALRSAVGTIGAKPRGLTYSIVKQPSDLVPSFARAWGRPVSLSLPPMRGVARREGAWPGFRQTGPIARAGPERRDPDAHDACVRVFPARHAASSAFAFSASRTGPRSLVPRGGAPSAARGGDLR